jgi:hypothetical protein
MEATLPVLPPASSQEFGLTPMFITNNGGEFDDLSDFSLDPEYFFS